MDRADVALLQPTTKTTTTFIFTVSCEGGNFAPIIEAFDEPAAWQKLISEYQLRGVSSIEVEVLGD